MMSPSPVSAAPTLGAAPAGAAPAVAHASSLAEAQPTANASPQGQQSLRNAQILQASLQVSIGAGNDSLALLYRTAVEGINTALEAELGPNAVHNAMGQDHSPEATAGRIVGISTAMFEAFAARHPNQDWAEVAKDFVNVIRGGFEQGYQEAENILNSLGVLPDVQAVAQGISHTYALVQKGYDDWLSAKLSSLRGDAPAPSTSSA